ncbi:MAG: hypothetical protein JNL01_16685 [Bdellovibrionales bacterium]|nr:hypothetical protein [Bdellovibrionales bacterium]
MHHFKSKILALFALLFLDGFISGKAALAAPTAPSGNVILITLDGVRYREIFKGVQMSKKAGEKKGSSLIPDIEKIIQANGFSFGNKWKDSWGKTRSPMVISNKIALSQPGYTSILSGVFEEKCRENGCPNTPHETVIDRLILKEKTDPKKVATFASWDLIDRVLEKGAQTAVRSIEFGPVRGLTPQESAPFDAIQAQALVDRPTRWGGSRWDKYTFEMGHLYLKTFQPKFLYMMFVEPDEYAHKKDYPGYLATLRDFNSRFVQLVDTLKSMGSYGANTSIVVTTDHGRGRGLLFPKHSREWLDSRYIWALVLPSENFRKQAGIRATEDDRFFHVDIRPTLEKLMGLEPSKISTGGRRKSGRSLVTVD